MPTQAQRGGNFDEIVVRVWPELHPQAGDDEEKSDPKVSQVTGLEECTDLIEHLSKIYRKSIENLSNIYRASIEHLSNKSIEHPSNMSRTCIEHLSNIYRTSIEHLSKICRKSIEIHEKRFFAKTRCFHMN